MLSPYSADVTWLVVFSFIIAFVLAVAVGANDVANSYGTSVGSGVLTFRQACVLATIFETSGSILIGYKVADTMRKGILDVTLYEGDEKVLMMGMLSALIGCSCWLLIATYFSLPVSTTHSIVGSTVGFSLVVKGVEGLRLDTMIQISISWFVSPLLSGSLGILIYFVIDRLIARRENPLRAGLIALPIIYGLTIFINVLSVVIDGSQLLGLQNTPEWFPYLISVIALMLSVIIAQFIIVPQQRTKSMKMDMEGSQGDGLTTAIALDSGRNWQIVNGLFNLLQILSAVFTSFAHGGNDVTNAVGPLIAIWITFSEGSVSQKAEAPILILLFGGVGMAIGMWLFGKRVNDTVGQNITKITSTTGFVVETSSAVTVLMASKFGIPVSSTHCIVGSLVSIGFFFGAKKVDWHLFRSIVYAWLVTLPVAGGLSALCMYGFVKLA